MNKNPTILCLFGTRPEVIKMGPVLRALEELGNSKRVLVSSEQQADLLPAFISELGIAVADRLDAMQKGQSINQLLSELIKSLETSYERHAPDAVLLQGDTTTALAGALSAFHQKIPVMHIESGLRTDNKYSPFPEEVNRRLITQLSSLHFAPTERNYKALIQEGVADRNIVLSGNPIVDAVQMVIDSGGASDRCKTLVSRASGHRIVVVTMHRRENFGARLCGYFAAIKEFATRKNVFVVLPLHPNPEPRAAAQEIFSDSENVHLVEPFNYPDFIYLLSHAWLALSDSGGIQEEVSTLGIPLLVLREVTERPEILENGTAKLIVTPDALRNELNQIENNPAWLEEVKNKANPFGNGDSGVLIARAILDFLSRTE